MADRTDSAAAQAYSGPLVVSSPLPSRRSRVDDSNINTQRAFLATSVDTSARETGRTTREAQYDDVEQSPQHPSSEQDMQALARHSHLNVTVLLPRRRAIYRNDVINSLPAALPLDQLDPVKAALKFNGSPEPANYAKWAGGYVEIDEKLIAEDICPADLLGFPCEHDEFFYLDGDGCGCQKIRLCVAISKRLAVRCPGPGSCPHIHPFDMDQSCRFVVKRRDDGTINCNQVFKNHMCSRGHNLVTARQTAYEQFDVHKAEARSLGSFGNVKFKRF